MLQLFEGSTRGRCRRSAPARLALLAAIAASACGSSPAYTQAQQDGEVALGLIEGINRHFLTALAALAPGAVDVTTDCSGGGTVRANGSYSRRSDGKLQGRELLYSFAECRFNAVSTLFSLTLSGDLREVGAYSEASGVWASTSTYEASQLALAGNGMGVPASGGNPVPFTIDERGPVSLARSVDGDTSRTTGSLFGRPVEVAEGPSGGAGGGGGDCLATAEEARCCATAGGIQTAGITVPSRCDCPAGTCFLGLDQVNDVKMCGCSACGGC